MKNYIRCKNCMISGQTRTLGEILPDGSIAIKRVDAYNQRIDYTILLGTHYMLMCGNCKTGVEITIERRADEGFNYGTQWLFRKTFSGPTYQERLGSNGTTSSVVGTV